MNNYLGFDARRRFRNGRGKLLELLEELELTATRRMWR